MTTENHPQQPLEIIVDKKPVHLTVRPTTGSELRAALDTPDNRDLYEEGAQGDDPLITDDYDLRGLKNGTKFFTAPRHITPGRF